ncbi:hypothetical protein BBJ28_00026232, partial [Nothophytophthora sp. Chile5]
MAARRETWSEADAFMARLTGRSLEERHRLATEHREFLSGARDTDADFDPDPTAPPVTVTPPSALSGCRPSSPVSSRLLPVGKAASYLAALVASQKKEKAARTVGKASSGKGKGKAPSGKGKARAKPKAPPKPKKLMAKQQAAADKKAAKEAAEARAAAERAARATAKQVTTVEAELRGDEEVRQARAQLDAKEEEMEKKREEKKAETERRRQEKKAAEKARKQA